MPQKKLNLDKLQDFQPVPPGQYTCRLISVEEEVSAAGNAMWVWDWEVSRGPHAGKAVRSWTVTEGEYQGQLKSHLTAFGLSGAVSVDTDRLVGREAELTLTIREYQNPRTGEARQNNSVSSLGPIAKAAPAAGEVYAKGARKGAKAAEAPVEEESEKYAEIPF